MPEIRPENLRKDYGAVTVIENLNLEMADGGFTVLVGPPGCGKSTTLRMMAGLESVTSGQTGGCGIGIPADAQNKETAVLLMHLLKCTEQDLAIAMAGGNSSRLSTYQGFGLNDKDANQRPNIPTRRTINADICTMASQVVDPQRALDDVAERARVIMDEAARIDRTGPFQVFFLVVLPRIKPGIAAALIFTFRVTWNEFLLANALADRNSRTEFDIDWGVIMVTGMILAVPPIIVTFVASRQIITCMTAGVVKG